MNGLRKVLRVVDVVVFVCATLAIAGVFCEGMAKKWYDFAGIPYHPLVLTIWFQYIWFLYGIILARRYLVR